ncbi:MAG: hypothetical protein AAF696_38880 [Bacteroidota bacterium]
MEEQKADIFQSDLLFIEFASSILLGIGIVLFPLGLSCKIIDWAYCDIHLVSLFGGEDKFKADLSAINLPLAMLILGISARLYTKFGWSICILLLGFLSSFFGFMAYYLNQKLNIRLIENTLDLVPQGQFSYVESIIINGVLAILCFVSLIYFLLPKTRRLFWDQAYLNSQSKF